MALIRFLIMLVWALVFIVLLLFAAKNVETVTLRFYFDRAWEAPLIVVVLAAFAAVRCSASSPACLRRFANGAISWD